MPLPVASVAPLAILQGDTLTWVVSSADASPASGDTLSLRVSSVRTTTEVAGVANAGGRDWTVLVSADQTRALGSGILKWMTRVTYAAGQVQVLGSGLITAAMLPELGAGAGAVSGAERTLALWLARAEQQAGDLLLKYTVGDRTAERYTPKQVQEAIAFWRGAVARERNGGRLASAAVRFGYAQ
jgi:hypothetical protein